MSAPQQTRPGRSRNTVVAVVLLILAAAALWGSSRMTWVRVESADGLGADRVTELNGGAWAAATTPLALVLLAAVAAVLAVRGTAVRIVAAAVALAAVAAAIGPVDLLATGADADTAAQIAALPDRAEVTATDVFVFPALLALAGAVFAVAAAVAAWLTPVAQAGLSSKYDSPGARKEATARLADSPAGTDEPVTERALWDALDSGIDPTVDGGDDDPGDEGRSDSSPSGTRR